jgi:hypothetical protein
MNERRRHRSKDPIQALSLYLLSERQRRGAAAIAVATLDGEPVAGVGSIEAGRVASAAWLKLKGLGTEDLIGALATAPFSIAVVPGAPLMLASVGGVDRPQADVDIARILGH